MYDENGELMDGQVVKSKVLYHIRDFGLNWYVLFLEDFHVESDPENWWCAFDLRKEEFVR